MLPQSFIPGMEPSARSSSHSWGQCQEVFLAWEGVKPLAFLTCSSLMSFEN